MKIVNFIRRVHINKIIFILVIVFNIFLIIKGIAEKKYFEKEIHSYNVKIKDNNNLFIQDLNLLSQEIVIDYDVLKDYLPKEPFLLIYAYSGEECNKCILQDIMELKEKLKKNYINDVLVLPVMENTRNVNIGLKADLGGINYKRLDKGLIKFPIQNGIQRRFFFILTSGDKILLPFFPEVSSPEKTGAYLDFVFAKYFKSDQDSIRK